MKDLQVFKKIGSPGMRGMLNLWIISLLNKKEMNGYEIVNEISDITGSYWKPTTGSIYPALHKLKKDGIIKELRKGTRKQVIYTLTPEGKEFVSKIKERVMVHTRSPKFRRIFDSLIWPNEPESIRDEAEKIYQHLVEIRSMANRKNSKKIEGILKKTNKILEHEIHSIK